MNPPSGIGSAGSAGPADSGGAGQRSPARGSADLPPGSSLWLHDLARWIGTWCFRPAFRIRVHGRDRVPPEGPVVLVANHSAMLDGPLLFGLLGRRVVFLVKQEMFRGPMGWALPLIGQLSVRRSEPDRGPLMAAVSVLRGGGLIGVFPEGTRGSGDVAVAQHGAAWLARMSGAVVLPVVCRGTYRPPAVAAAGRRAGGAADGTTRQRWSSRTGRRYRDGAGRVGCTGHRT